MKCFESKDGASWSVTLPMAYYYQHQIRIFLAHRRKCKPKTHFLYVHPFLPPQLFPPFNSLLFNLPRISLIWSAFITSASSLGFLETLISLRTIKAAWLRAGLRAMSGEQWQSCSFMNSFHLYFLCVFPSFFFCFSLYFAFQMFCWYVSSDCLAAWVCVLGISVPLKPLIFHAAAKTISPP